MSSCIFEVHHCAGLLCHDSISNCDGHSKSVVGRARSLGVTVVSSTMYRCECTYVSRPEALHHACNCARYRQAEEGNIDCAEQCTVLLHTSQTEHDFEARMPPAMAKPLNTKNALLIAISSQKLIPGYLAEPAGLVQHPRSSVRPASFRYRHTRVSSR